jgi:hypothetical protein
MLAWYRKHDTNALWVFAGVVNDAETAVQFCPPDGRAIIGWGTTISVVQLVLE